MSANNFTLRRILRNILQLNTINFYLPLNKNKIIKQNIFIIT